MSGSFTQQELREYLHYNPETGEWRWLKGIGKKKFGVAGTVNWHNRRRYIKFKQEQYAAYRLAWFYMTGQWPIEIDHKDRDSLNDRWNNLREVTHRQNCFNRVGCAGVVI